MAITMDLCKAAGRLQKDAARKTGDPKKKVWHKDGPLAIKASAVNSKNHAFHHRPANGGSWRVFAKLTDLEALKQGGTRTLKDIRAEAKRLSKNEMRRQALSEMPTLRECLAKKLKRGSKATNEDSLRDSASDDIERSISIFAHDWLNLSVTELTEKRIADRLEEIKDGDFEHPYFGFNKEQLAEAAKIRGLKSSIRPCRKKRVGTKKTADSFARYLRLVLVGTSDQHLFTLDNNPVSTAQSNVVGKIEPDRPATCIEDHEIAAILNSTREICARSRRFDVIRWQKMLGLKFALLSGYRIGDITTLHDGNIDGDFLFKRPSEALKTKRAHRLPVSTQMRDIIDEARAIRDRDVDALMHRFRWTEEEVAEFQQFETFEMANDIDPLIFPDLKTGKKYKQNSQLSRPSRDLMVKHGLIKAEQRVNPETEVPYKHPCVLKPHDLRATFSTHCELADVDEIQTARFMNHAVSIGGVKMTAKYKSKQKFDERALVAMQRVSDHLYEIAAGRTT